MDILDSLAIISLAALVHASFQLSVSVLTLLSGHTIGSKRSNIRLFGLMTSFILGTVLMTLLIISSTSFVLVNIFETTPPALWTVGCGLLLGVAIAIWLFYYRRQKGTSLWIPRSMADYLTERTRKTHHNAEAFGLGLTSVTAEILFIIAPLFISSLVLTQLPPTWQIIGVAIYTAVSSLSLIIVWMLVGSGHSLSKIQKWREYNKYFLQFVSGAGLVILGVFVYVTIVMSSSAGLN
ncbi:hypothetical protein HGB25_01225 [Candidatus Saccharibacteria bacterium]|nr:hypothetical protein [Candidatus Saccharibacteria bacterium]